jgi:hypothetical protein
MEQKPPLTLDDKLDVVAQLCNGLGYAHTQGIVHRDVKPANVFILEDGTVKLLDFGIAKLATSTLTRQGDVVGSAPYMSPEQIAGTQDIDGRSDVWSTGVLLFELLTGKKPFDGDALTTVVMGILKNEPPPVDQLIPGMPKAVAEVVTRALHKDRDRRYQTAEELGRELQLIRKTQQLSNLPPMDATRFASTNVLKALHDDRQKQEQGAPADQTLQPAPAHAAATAAQSRSKTSIIGVAAAVVIVAVGLGYAMLRSDDPVAPVSGAGADGSRLATAEPVSAPPAATPPPATATVPPETTSAPGAINKLAAPAVATKKSAEPPPVKKSTAPGTEPAAAVSAPPPVKSAPANVAVTLSGTYPFEVWDGSRLISGAARSHELPPQANGKTLRIVASDVFLDRQVKVDGGDDQRFDHAAPGLGRIEIRATRGECKAMVGKKDLGYGPWPPQNAVVGEHRVTLVCPDDQNPVQHVLVTQGRPARATFQAK